MKSYIFRWISSLICFRNFRNKFHGDWPQCHKTTSQEVQTLCTWFDACTWDPDYNGLQYDNTDANGWWSLRSYMAKSVITQYCVSVSRYGEVYSRRERPADQGHAWALIKAPTRRPPFCKYNAQIHFLQRNVSVLIERLLKFKFVINCISNPSNIYMSLSWKWITVPVSLEPIPDFLFVSVCT